MSIASRIARLTRKAAAGPCPSCASTPQVVFTYLDDPADEDEADAPAACAVCGTVPLWVVFAYDEGPTRDGLETLAA